MRCRKYLHQELPERGGVPRSICGIRLERAIVDLKSSAIFAECRGQMLKGCRIAFA